MEKVFDFEFASEYAETKYERLGIADAFQQISFDALSMMFNNFDALS